MLVGLALGAALLAYLNQTAASSFADLESKLVAWLDPISGVDQKCEILRAATSILVEQKKPYQTIAEVLVTSWLQSQNVPESHRRDFEALAPSLLDPLLDAIEHSEGRVHGSARLWRPARCVQSLEPTGLRSRQLSSVRVAGCVQSLVRSIHDASGTKSSRSAARLDSWSGSVVTLPGPSQSPALSSSLSTIQATPSPESCHQSSGAFHSLRSWQSSRPPRLLSRLPTPLQLGMALDGSAY